MRRLLPLILLGLINDISMSSSFRYSRLAASPLIIYSGDDDHLHQLPGDRVTSSLLQKLASTSSGAVLPVPLRVGGWVLPVLGGGGSSHQGKTQRRAMTLGSRLEPVAGELMSPAVKAMRYGKRSQRAVVASH